MARVYTRCQGLSRDESHTLVSVFSSIICVCVTLLTSTLLLKLKTKNQRDRYCTDKIKTSFLKC
jgi:hypothetical protein